MALITSYKNTATVIKNGSAYDKGSYRSIFDLNGGGSGLRVYIKSKLKIYEAVVAGEARLEREEFCASKFTFTVLKDSTLSFDQGDAVSVKYDGENIFFGFVFAKSRDKEGLIEVTAYDQMRYMKNKRTYTRGRMTLDEIISKMAAEYSLRTGVIEKSNIKLMPVAAENVSLLDVALKAAADTMENGGERYILYDDAGYLTLKRESAMTTNIYIDSSLAENYVYRDSIDTGVYNTVEVYNDTARLNLRALAASSDGETVKKWGTLILSKKAENVGAMESEARALLKRYDRINREIVLKCAAGNTALRGGCRVYVNMTMGDLSLAGQMRVKKAVHCFEDNAYTADVYLDGSEIEY